MPGREPLPILTPQHDRYDRAAGLRPEVRALARALADRDDNPLCAALAAALDDPYQAEWMAAGARSEALDWWEFELPPAAAAIFNAWADAQERNQLLAEGHQLLALLASVLEVTR